MSLTSLLAFLLQVTVVLNMVIIPTDTSSITGSGDQVSLRIHPISPTTSELVAYNLGNGSSGLPVVAWDVYLNFDHTKGRLAKVSPGKAWTALDCGFSVNVVDGTGTFGVNDVFLSGFCTTKVTAGVTGDEIVLATLDWSNCRSGFLVDLRSGNSQFDKQLTGTVDVSLTEEKPVMESDLFDGGTCGDTTEGIQTTIDNPLPQASPLATSAPILALLVGGVILAAAAAAAFLRLRRP